MSITAGLALFYTLSVFVLLAFSTGFLYWSVTNTMELDDQQFLSAKIRSIRTILGEHEAHPALRIEELVHEVVVEGGLYEEEQHFIFHTRVLDEAGKVVIETPGMADVIPQALFPPPIGLAETRPELQYWRSPKERDYWLVSALGRTAGGKLHVIQVALDDTVEATLLSNYRARSIAVLVVGTTFFACIGLFAIRRGMRPLRNIAATANAITPSQLHRRLDPSEWPRELAAVAEGFNHMLDRLEDSFARLLRFSSDLAHEFRNPIHILISEAEVGLLKPQTPEECRDILESNLEEYNRLARMINGLLFLARAEDPRTKIERTRFDVRSELEAVRQFHEVLAEDMGVTVACEGNGEINGDPALFRRAVTNLVSNALRHTPEGGTVTLVIGRPDDESVAVTVRDTGPGIATEELPRIFDRFYRTDDGVPLSEGTGLGLAITKSIVELHGGAITAESAPGKGTAFILRFPASASEEQ